jgi:hypothetical protein
VKSGRRVKSHNATSKYRRADDHYDRVYDTGATKNGLDFTRLPLFLNIHKIKAPPK